MTSAVASSLGGANAARAPFFKNDLEVLNYALTLEHLEATFYKQVVAGGKLTGNALKALTVIRDHEVAHVDALTATITKLGGTPVAPRKSYTFAPLGDVATQAGILAIAAKLEATGVGAYDGAARELTDKGLLGVAGQIVQVEARHTAMIRALQNPDASPAPKATEELLRPDAVLAAVAPLLGPE